jgi:hypothetical protein
VPPGEERWLKLYHYDGASWQILPTTLDMDHNLAAAAVQGPGLYALMSSIEVALLPGWNNFAYPIPETRPVTTTLLSISGTYGIVYGYDGGNPADPWAVYGVGAPSWVNDLVEFEFGQGYWISTTEAITLYLKGASGGGLGEGFPVPPATYYGAVHAGGGFTPTPGLTVTAWVDGQLCGQGQTLEVGGEVVYVLSVEADLQTPGCGRPGSLVVFRAGGRILAPAARWDNGRLWEWPLGVGWQAYLPLVSRER